MNLKDTITVINIIDEDKDIVRCTKVSKVHLEKTNQVAVSGSQIISEDTVAVYYGLRQSKSSRERVSAAEFTADPIDEGIFSFRKGDYIAEGDLSFSSIDELNTAKQKMGNVYEIVSVAEYLFGGIANIQLTCK